MFDPSFYINLTEIVVCFSFTIFLIIVYLSKKNINNIENKIYKNIVIWTLLNLLASIIMCTLLVYSDVEFIKLFYKFFFISVATWIYFLMFYLIVVTNEHREKFYSFVTKRFNLCLFASYVFLAFLYSFFFMMDYDVFIIKNGVLSELSGFIYTYYSIIMLTFAVIALFSIIINFKDTSKKKLIPFFLMLPIGLVVLALGVLLPKVAMVQCLYTLVCYLMYHTIENPDVKMLNELELAKNALEKSNNAKSDFLSSMSHEIRTPLNAIVGCTDLILSSNNLDEIYNDCHDIKDASNKLIELVDGILDFNNIETNSFELNPKDYDLKGLLNDIVDLIKMRIGDKNVSLNYRFADNIPDILYGDKEKIKTIIVNLLTNAVKYTDEGTIDFDVSCLVNKDRCSIRVTVSDTGRGIKEEDIDNLYDKFYRSDDIKDSTIEGAGLGLSITKSLLELMEGKISVNSNYGEGSTFTVTIPQKIINTNE
ncbi:MAG: HAMP domain-containing histidine kinase [Bacilli bacterium]|nr:HAMP domain-containing histidine kinase [Bacilli bacterium]